MSTNETRTTGDEEGWHGIWLCPPVDESSVIEFEIWSGLNKSTCRVDCFHGWGSVVETLHGVELMQHLHNQGVGPFPHEVAVS